MTAFGLASLWATACIASLAAAAAAAVSAQPRTVPMPELLPDVIHPTPGPFIVHYELDGTLTGDANGIIAHAARSWMVNGLDSYTLCYQPGADERVARSGFAALRNVARQLKAQGAATVVTTSGGRCSADWSAKGAAPPYVYIMGSVRL